MTFLDGREGHRQQPAGPGAGRPPTPSTPRTSRAIATRRQAGHWVSPAWRIPDRPPQGAARRLRGAWSPPPSSSTCGTSTQDRLRVRPDAAGDVSGLRDGAVPLRPALPALLRSRRYAESQDWDILKALREKIEAAYVNGFVTNLALAWGKFVEPAGCSTQVADRRRSQSTTLLYREACSPRRG